MRRLYSALKYVCIVALVISMIALVAVVEITSATIQTYLSAEYAFLISSHLVFLF